MNLLGAVYEILWVSAAIGIPALIAVGFQWWEDSRDEKQFFEKIEEYRRDFE